MNYTLFVWRLFTADRRNQRLNKEGDEDVYLNRPYMFDDGSNEYGDEVS
ncbi:hypothetical protein WMC59_04655 [Staphylococcus delphini]